MNSVFYNYLLLEKNLSIPGVGTIRIDRVPARTDIANRQVLPAFYSFRFDKYFDAPDKDFFSYLAARMEMADYEAIRWYNEWAYNISTRIRDNKPVELERVGILKRDPSGEIVLEAFLLPDSLQQPVDAQKFVHADASHTVIVGDRELSKDDMNAYLEATRLKNGPRWWVYALLLALLAIVVLIWHLASGGAGIPSIGNQQGL